MDSKIFIDTDEEITFIVEKIKLAPNTNVVLIAPDRASIFITSASLKLLQRAIEQLDKRVILVTMDESGRKMADGIGIQTVHRVREVTPELWEEVKKAKHEKSLSKNIHHPIIESVPTETPTIEEVVEEEPIIQEKEETILPNFNGKFEFKNNNVGDIKDSGILAEENTEGDGTMDLIASNDISDTNSEKQEIEEETFEQTPIDDDTRENAGDEPLRQDNEDEIEGKFIENIEEKPPESVLNKKRKFILPNFKVSAKPIEEEPVIEEKIEIKPEIKEEEPKEFLFVFGKDVKEHISLKSEKKTIEDMSKPANKTSYPTRRLHPQEKFLAILLTKINSIRNSVFSYVTQFINRLRTNKATGRKKPINKRKIYIALGSFLLILILFGWYLSQFAPSIRVSAQTIDHKIKKNIAVQANFGATDGIIAINKTQTEKSSDSQPATGTAQKGTAATGSVKATYLQASGSITIKAGTTLTCSNTTDCGGQALTFTTQEEHTFSVSQSQQTVNITASAIGSEYNLKPSTKFKFSNVSESDLFGINIQALSGGDKKDVKVVSQSDFDQVKARLSDALKSVGVSQIQRDNPNLKFLDNAKVEIKSTTPDQNIVGKEADILNMDMEANVTASGYDESSVRPYVEKVLKEDPISQDNSLSLDLNSIDITQNIKSSTSTYILLDLSVTGLYKSTANKDEIVSKLVGKKLEDVKGIIDGYKNIKYESYAYEPNWAPGFLKHVPSSKANIILDLKSTVVED